MAKVRRFNTTGVCVPELHYMVEHVTIEVEKQGKFFNNSPCRTSIFRISSLSTSYSPIPHSLHLGRIQVHGK